MSSQDRKDRGGAELTQFEVARPRKDANTPSARPADGFAPMVTQPFDAYALSGWQPEAPATPAPEPVRVSVGRVQGVGQQAVIGAAPAAPPSAPPRAPEPSPAFGHTMIAAGHRSQGVPASPKPPPQLPPQDDLRMASLSPRPRATPPAPSQSPEATQPRPLNPQDATTLSPAEVAKSLHEQAKKAMRSERAPTPTHEQQAMTTSVDFKELLKGHAVRMPELGKAEDSSSSWAAAVTEPRSQELPEPKRKRGVAQVEEALPTKSAKPLLMLVGLALAVGLMAWSFMAKRSSNEAPLAMAPEAPSEPELGSGVPPSEQPPEAPAEANPEPQEAAKAETEAHAPTPHAAGSATAASAAALYISGQYKEALAEYRLLSRAYPREAVYGELARILRRKLIESCERTHDNRQDACKEI